MHIVTYHEDDYEDAAALHRDVAASLEFPSYYGKNFSALMDCLEDIDCETLVICDRGVKERAFFDTFLTVCERAALENPALSVRVTKNGRPECPAACAGEYADRAAAFEDE